MPKEPRMDGMGWLGREEDLVGARTAMRGEGRNGLHTSHALGTTGCGTQGLHRWAWHPGVSNSRGLLVGELLQAEIEASERGVYDA